MIAALRDQALALVRGTLKQALRLLVGFGSVALLALDTVVVAVGGFSNRFLPKGLYARSLIIVVAPLIVLQSVLAFVFMERHWQMVTERLSSAVVSDIAALIDIYRAAPNGQNAEAVKALARGRLNMSVEFMPREPLPLPGPKPFFDVLDTALSREINLQIARPFWVDTVGRSTLVEIRILLDGAVMQILAPRNNAYASNSYIFLMWMVGTSFVLMLVSILFLRNQILPIQALAKAAESFGKGRDVPNFRPRGAREVRSAAKAFLEMKSRIERQIDQRTTMLAGVSHDLRTVLTRFRLELALLPESPETEGMARDIDEMSRMLEGYLAFARGDAGEAAIPTDVAALLEELRLDAERGGHPIISRFTGDANVTLRPDAFKRCLANLISNAARHGSTVEVTGETRSGLLVITVDDDGPGIAEEMREEVFKPFLRLDDARNQDEGGSGLGLAIARDIARSHGGDVLLSTSPLGGLRAMVRVPV